MPRIIPPKPDGSIHQAAEDFVTAAREALALQTFTERKLACSEDDAWAFAAVTSHLANANGVYRGPAWHER